MILVILLALGALPESTGIVNCVEGEVSMDGTPVRPVDVGSARIAAGHAIKTGEGMAEVLLGPGSILRLGNRSELTFETLGQAEVQARLSKGEAMVEVIEPSSRRVVILTANKTTAVIQKPGLYHFHSHHGRDVSSALYAWSKLRAEQLSAESAATAQTYPGGPGKWHGPAWYWNPLFGSYAFMPASGFVNDPFGWPFYAPGHTHNFIPRYRGGDSYLYGPPIPAGGSHVQSDIAPNRGTVPTVPLTAPGVPSFPNSRGRL